MIKLKKAVFTFLIFITLNGYSQQIKKDTIYIYFKHSKKELIVKNFLNICDKAYVYNFSTNKEFYDNSFPFGNKIFYGFMYNNVSISTLTLKHKSFLRKNKIYTYCDFKKMNIKDLHVFYHKNKYSTIFLIDKKENSKGNIFLKKVEFITPFPKVQ